MVPDRIQAELPPNSQIQTTPTLAVAASFTAEPLGETLAFWMNELGLAYDIRFAPYNQLFQQILDPASLLAANRTGINVVLLRFEDWMRFAPSRSLDDLESDVRQFLTLLDSAARSSANPLILAICPASPAFASDPARAEFQRRMTALAASQLRGAGTVYVITQADLDELYPVAEPHDPHADELGHVPYTLEFFAALGAVLARRIHALRVAPFKVIVLDCDDTLWSGICGEDGPEAVVLDEPRRALQEFVLAQREAGMLLCLASKNNPEDVEETFRVHPEMPLRPEHFIASRVNWESKAKNLRELADELDLSLDSFILIDDNPKECSEVQASCPEVLTLALPPRAEEIPDFLRHVWAFDHLRITEEDRQRNELYAQRVQRGRAEKHAANLEDFLASLQLEIAIAPMPPAHLPRVSQLTQRTNQMNFTSIRRSEAEIRELIDSGAAECLTVTVSDRFGSYGVTGVMIYRASKEALAVDTFLLSCRALGRGVEHRMLAKLGEIARERGIPEVHAPYRRTQRNQPALLFLESAGKPYERGDGDDLRFEFPADSAAAIVYRPNGRPKHAERDEKAAAGPARKPVEYEYIAHALRTPGQVVEQLRRNRRARPGSAGVATPPRTELERRLAAIWSDALGLTSVGVDDNFFDLGGHSLLAVELLSRVRRELGVDLSLEVVYTGDFTIAELAKAIELKEIERADADEYAALIEELEKLSDEEVRQLLAQEGGEAP
jgi:FkbH-like protein